MVSVFWHYKVNNGWKFIRWRMVKLSFQNKYSKEMNGEESYTESIGRMVRRKLRKRLTPTTWGDLFKRRAQLRLQSSFISDFHLCKVRTFPNQTHLTSGQLSTLSKGFSYFYWSVVVLNVSISHTCIYSWYKALK